jgi:hypothetical protein
MNKQVRVVVHATPDKDGTFEFRLIFDDNCEKYFNMSLYEFRALRCTEREAIEGTVWSYYDDLGETPDSISLVFL